MASIEGRHFYRFKYLKSDHWQDLRLRKLVQVDAHCIRCDLRDLSNDVHHLNYRNLYDVELDDLVVLCRECHAKVHEGLERHREHMEKRGLKKSSWRDTRKMLCWVDCGIMNPDEESFTAYRKRRKAEELAKKKAAKAELEAARRKAKPVRPSAKTAEIFKEGRRTGFANPLTKPLFIALDRVRFWAETP